MTDVSRWRHRCTDTACPFVGQVTSAGCACHVTVDAMMSARICELEAGVREIQWQKDCGCDSIDPATREMVNHAEVERDSMYEIATRLVGPSPEELMRRRSRPVAETDGVEEPSRLIAP